MRLTVKTSLALCIALLALTAAPWARAEPAGAAARYYAAGDYLAAAELALDERSPAGFSFAARALMAECISSRDRDQIDALLTRAEAAAHRALALDPDSVEARLQLALALGVRARQTDLAEAFQRGYAPQGRRLIEQALERDPNNAWGHALLGGWHLEVLRRGGRMGALIYHARLADGLAGFDEARRLAPDDPLIALHYAVALLELDPNRFGARAAELLADVAALAPRDAFETYAAAAARRLADTLQNQGPQAASRAAREAFL
jgi:hypothetical protein